MSTNYNVNVNIKGKEKIDALEKQLNTLSKKPVKIAVDIDNKHVDTALNKMSKSAEKHKIKPAVDTSGIDESIKKAQSISRNSFIEELEQGFKQIAKFKSVFGEIQSIPDVIRQMSKEVLNIDTAMAELQKSSNANDTQLNSYFERAAESAKHYGTAISDIINNTANWNKLGYSLEESKKLSDATALLQRIGSNMTQESSASGLLSAMKGFGKNADEALSIVDKITQVTNTQPIDAASLFVGLESSASSMNAANNTLEQTISLITAANSAGQDPASIGTAYKTISMRLRGASDELKAAGLDTEGMAESTSKLREEIMALSGVDIILDNGSLKSTYVILDELAAKWKSLSAVEQTSVSDLIAGKSHGDIIPALMQNFNIARETLNTASYKSDGSAERELNNYQKSMQYSIDAFKAQFQELSNITLNSDFLKSAADAGTRLLEISTQIMDIGGGIPALFSAIGSTAILKNLDEPTNHRVSA